MEAFDYCNPTKIVFGRDRIRELGKIAKSFGNRAMFVTYDKEATEKIGLLEKALEPLKESGIVLDEYYGVKSNPSLEHARNGVKRAEQFCPDVIIALGGGSVIDESKCIAAAYKSKVDIWDMVEDPTRLTDALPVIAVCTIPATSSEMNCIAVISNDETGVKDGLEGQQLYPAVALLDPDLTISIPLRQTAFSSADIVCHLIEGYVSHQEMFVPMEHLYCEGLIKTQMICMERLLVNPGDIDARAQLMWAATNSWNGFCVLGYGEYEALNHAIGHIVSEMYDTPHGATMAMVMPAVLSYTADRRIQRYAGLAREVFQCTEGDDKKAANALSGFMRSWLEHIGAPADFKQGRIPTDRIKELKERAYNNVVRYGYGRTYSKEDIDNIIDLCL